MIILRIIVGLSLIALAICLGGMNIDAWGMVFWPQSDVMEQLQWTSAVIALLGTALTVIVGMVGIFVLFWNGCIKQDE